MSLRYSIAIGVLLAVASQHTFAFDEQPSGGAPVAAPAPSAKTESSPKPVALDAPAPVGKVEGTEISIPGLGKLGVLPKMDFGLELLYGANEQPKQAEGDPAVAPPVDDDLTIRGSIKKNF